MIRCPNCGSTAQVKPNGQIQISSNHLYITEPYICDCGCHSTVLQSREENKGEITESEFQVTITETSKMTVTVEANSPEDAKQIACDNWHKGEYILDADNFVDVDFEVKKGET